MSTPRDDLHRLVDELDDGAHDAGLLVTERFIGRDQVVNTDHVLDELLRPPVPA